MPDVCGTKKASVPQSEVRCFTKVGILFFAKCGRSSFISAIYNAGEYITERGEIFVLFLY
jgi:hypothetical protein